jgi:hypothetical protein
LNKITYGGLAGVLAALVFYVLRKYMGVELDTELATLVTSLIAVGVAQFFAWLTPLSEKEVNAIVQSPDAPAQAPLPPRAEPPTGDPL